MLDKIAWKYARVVLVVACSDLIIQLLRAFRAAKASPNMFERRTHLMGKNIMYDVRINIGQTSRAESGPH